MQFPFYILLMTWHYMSHKLPAKHPHRDLYTSERGKFSHFYSKPAIYFMLFFCYFTYLVGIIWYSTVKYGGGGGNSSVASLLARPRNVPTKIYILILRERSERAPRKHIFSGLKIHLHAIHIYNQCSFIYLLMVRRYKRHYTDKTLTFNNNWNNLPVNLRNITRRNRFCRLLKQELLKRILKFIIALNLVTTLKN